MLLISNGFHDTWHNSNLCRFYCPIPFFQSDVYYVRDRSLNFIHTWTPADEAIHHCVCEGERERGRQTARRGVSLHNTPCVTRSLISRRGLFAGRVSLLCPRHVQRVPSMHTPLQTPAFIFILALHDGPALLYTNTNTQPYRGTVRSVLSVETVL